MRLLIDECVDERIRNLFLGHECLTARYAKLAGLSNGELLSAAERAGFEALITVDQNIPSQQNLSGRKIAVLILCAPSNRLRDLAPLIPAALMALASVQPSQVLRVTWPDAPV
jgi:hypothetical protein